jgi:hypothetical protein
MQRFEQERARMRRISKLIREIQTLTEKQERIEQQIRQKIQEKRDLHQECISDSESEDIDIQVDILDDTIHVIPVE